MTQKLFQSINPANGKVLQSYPSHSPQEVDRILGQSISAKNGWQLQSIEQRAAALKKLAAALTAEKQALAELMQNEMGKSLAEGLAEVEKCATTALFYAEKGPGFLTDRPVQTDAAKSYVSFQPIGTVLLIMPWNFPLWQVLRVSIPSILAGNAIVLKHASSVSGCALALEKLWAKAIPELPLFQTLLISGESALQLLERKEIAAVSFTGSTIVGKKIGKKAGENLKKAVLELGGSDPYLILKDANLDAAAAICAKSRLINGGQSCIAAKRFIVEESVHDAFLEKFVEEMKKAQLAPLARADLREEVHALVEKSTRDGAQLVLGGKIPQGDGYFYPATVLANVAPGITSFEEEIFGPVASVVKARDREHALELANQSNFGLGAAIFSVDRKLAEKMAKEKLQAGSCFVNDFVRSDPRLPFGGTKESGYGRELSEFGLLEFVNVKTIWIN